MIVANRTGAARRAVPFALVLALCPAPARADAFPAYVADASNAANGTVSLELEIPESLSPRPAHVSRFRG